MKSSVLVRSSRSFTVLRSLLSQKSMACSSLDDPASSAGLRHKILKAPFQRVAPTGSSLFPWRHSPDLIPRLIPNSEAFEEKGQLLGGNVFSSNPNLDAYATAYMFLDVPWYKMLFFQYWKDDLAENVSWAFAQGVSGILSNVYRVQFDNIAQEDYHLDFKYRFSEDDYQQDKQQDEDELDIIEDVDYMVENNLRSLFECAHEYGKDQLQVRLECKPIHGGAKIVSLFAFPFLSRAALERNLGLKNKYRRLLELMTYSPREALPIYHELVIDYHERGFTESTVICQVLVPCEEIFWVKDLKTGTVVQGYEDEKIRNVYHLVRMEKVVTTYPAKRRILPFRHEQGNWQITDIDDMLDGNVLI